MFKNLAGGLGALGDMTTMMAKAQEMQQRMADLQQKLETIEVEADAGAGVVKAVCTAKGLLTRIEIDEASLKPEDREMIQDLIVAAVANAQIRAQERANAEMKAIADDMGLPPGMMPG